MFNLIAYISTLMFEKNQLFGITDEMKDSLNYKNTKYNDRDEFY